MVRIAQCPMQMRAAAGVIGRGGMGAGPYVLADVAVRGHVHAYACLLLLARTGAGHEEEAADDGLRFWQRRCLVVLGMMSGVEGHPCKSWC